MLEGITLSRLARSKEADSAGLAEVLGDVSKPCLALVTDLNRALSAARERRLLSPTRWRRGLALTDKGDASAALGVLDDLSRGRERWAD